MMSAKMILQDTILLKHDRINAGGLKQDTLTIKDSDTLKTISHGNTLKKSISKNPEDAKAQNKGKNDTYLKDKELSTAFNNKKTSDIIGYYTSDYPVVSSKQSEISFPYSLIKSSEKHKKELELKISEVAKDGIEIEKNILKSDWILPVILISLLVYLITGKAFSDFMKSLNKFFTFRITYDSGTTKSLRFSSALLDLISYINISLYCYLFITFFNFSTVAIKGYLVWIIIFISTVLISLARQSVTFLVGEISERKEIFTEYGKAVSCFYRSTGLTLFFIIIFLLYTNFFSTKVIFYTGFSIVILIYIIRMINLFIIFIKRRASILYLILYLCALEILPVAVLVKYLKQLLQNII